VSLRRIQEPYNRICVANELLIRDVNWTKEGIKNSKYQRLNWLILE
jgi:hypothetical protein